MTRDELFSAARERFPSGDCAQPFPFRDCFKVDQASCERFAKQAFDRCAKEMTPALPETFTDRDEVGIAGMQLGQCMGVRYAQALQSRVVAEPRCRELVASLRVWAPDEVKEFRAQMARESAPSRGLLFAVLAGALLLAAIVVFVVRRRRAGAATQKG